jgi:hypothetical protein
MYRKFAVDEILLLQRREGKKSVCLLCLALIYSAAKVRQVLAYASARIQRQSRGRLMVRVPCHAMSCQCQAKAPMLMLKFRPENAWSKRAAAGSMHVAVTIRNRAIEFRINMYSN